MANQFEEHLAGVLEGEPVLWESALVRRLGGLGTIAEQIAGTLRSGKVLELGAAMNNCMYGFELSTAIAYDDCTVYPVVQLGKVNAADRYIVVRPSEPGRAELLTFYGRDPQAVDRS